MRPITFIRLESGKDANKISWGTIHIDGHRGITIKRIDNANGVTYEIAEFDNRIQGYCWSEWKAFTSESEPINGCLSE